MSFFKISRPAQEQGPIAETTIGRPVGFRTNGRERNIQALKVKLVALGDRQRASGSTPVYRC